MLCENKEAANEPHTIAINLTFNLNVIYAFWIGCSVHTCEKTSFVMQFNRTISLVALIDLPNSIDLEFRENWFFNEESTGVGVGLLVFLKAI